MERKKSFIVWLVLLLALLAAFTGIIISPTLARYKDSSGEVNNGFTPAESVTPSVDKKEYEDEGWGHVEIGESKYSVWVRAQVVVTWKKTIDGNVNVYFLSPEIDTDYEMTLDQTAWEQIGNYYYYKTPVASGDSTAALVTHFSKLTEAPADGYELDLEIIAQTVQAVGTTDEGNSAAYKDAWDLTD